MPLHPSQIPVAAVSPAAPGEQHLALKPLGLPPLGLPSRRLLVGPGSELSPRIAQGGVTGQLGRPSRPVAGNARDSETVQLAIMPAYFRAVLQGQDPVGVACTSVPASCTPYSSSQLMTLLLGPPGATTAGRASSVTNVSPTLAVCMAAVWSPGTVTVRPTGVACSVTKVDGGQWAGPGLSSKAGTISESPTLVPRPELLWQPPPLCQRGYLHQR